MGRLDEASVDAALRAWDELLRRGEPVCFSVSRLKAGGAVAVAAGLVAAGVWILLDDGGWGPRLLGAGCVLLFLAAGVAALRTSSAPATRCG
ncbi:MAG: hypothetical protein R2731_11825 [Nocardioides sp.]